MKNWGLFGLLALIWGSSFLLIKQAVGAVGPLQLVTIRTGLAAIAFCVTILISRKQLPRDRKTWMYLALIGLTNTAIPFTLITWGETTIDSGIAGVLNGTVPLFSVVIAHLALADDRIHTGKIIGIITGFAGVVILAMRAATPGAANPLLGQLAVLVAAIFYAFSTVLIRRNLRHVDSMITSGVTITFGAIIQLVITLGLGQTFPPINTLSQEVIFALLTLGILNTYLAYLIYFYLIAAWGATRSTMVTYAMPPISITLGILFGSEHFDIRVVIGAALIISGVLVSNFWKQFASRMRPTESVA